MKIDKWHKYPNEIPPTTGDYLVTVKVETDWCKDYPMDVGFWNGDSWDKWDVVAWMSLPKPYKKMERIGNENRD